MKRNLYSKLQQVKKNKKGFTLIELIVVIAIIGVLAAMLVPSMAGYIGTAKESKNKANARTFYTAAQAMVTALEVTGDGSAITVDGEKETKLEQLMGEDNLAKCAPYTIKVDASGAVTEITVTIDGTVITFPEAE